MDEDKNGKKLISRQELDQLAQQRRYALDQILQSNAPEAEKTKAQQDYAASLVELQVLSGNLDISEYLAGLPVEISRKVNENIIAIQNDAAKKSLDVKKAMKDKQIELLELQEKELFSLRKEAITPTIRMMATFKALALVLKGLGIDTTEFVKFCDETIQNELSKAPQMNIATITKAGAAITSTAEGARLREGGDTTIEKQQNHAGKLQGGNISTGRALSHPTSGGETRANPQSSREGQPTADIETSRLINAAKGIKNLPGNVHLDQMIRNANKDPDKGHMSATELAMAETKLSMGLRNAGVQKAGEEARKIMEDLIARARQGAPAPQPT